MNIYSLCIQSLFQTGFKSLAATEQGLLFFFSVLGLPREVVVLFIYDRVGLVQVAARDVTTAT